jgi:hypothetical protein
LVGTYTRDTYTTNSVEARLTNAPLRDELKRLVLGDSLRLLGHYVGNISSLLSTLEREEFNTDDAPLVTFRAPRFVYERNATPYGRLLRLLETARNVDEIKSVTKDLAFATRVRAYTLARDTYLRGLVDDLEGNRDRAIDAYVESARLSAEFTSGYAQCLSIAASLNDIAAARHLLERLIAAQPDRPVAREMLRRLEERSR